MDIDVGGRVPSFRCVHQFPIREDQPEASIWDGTDERRLLSPHNPCKCVGKNAPRASNTLLWIINMLLQKASMDSSQSSFANDTYNGQVNRQTFLRYFEFFSRKPECLHDKHYKICILPVRYVLTMKPNTERTMTMVSPDAALKPAMSIACTSPTTI